MSNNPGAWMITHTGKRFSLGIDSSNPTWSDQIDIDDIAHGLSMTCRFGGQCPAFYSVAQHSVIVSHQVHPEYQLAALLHDASEAYIGDMPSPFKRSMPDYRRIEHSIMLAIESHFNLRDTQYDLIQEADRNVLHSEAIFFFGAHAPIELELPGHEIDGINFTPLSHPAAKDLFLARFYDLTG